MIEQKGIDKLLYEVGAALNALHLSAARNLSE